MDTTIICPHCKQPFAITDAIQHQIDDELIRAKDAQTASLQKQYEATLQEKVLQQVQQAVSQAQQDAELQLARERQRAQMELEKAYQTKELAVEQAKQSTLLTVERLQREAATAKEIEQELRKQLSSILEELSSARKAKEDAQFVAKKELLDKEKVIRAEAVQQASENFNTKIREQEETINRLREQLTTAKQVAEQGSQQMQGEILELDVEDHLRAAFPTDTITEVKKGERGADVRQIVNEKFYQNCGLILWECKNAKTFQASWLAKLKDELVTEKAQIGVIVFQSTDGAGSDFEQLDEAIWLIKPRYAVMLATVLREVLVRVFVANRNAEGKDVKVEMVYQYLTGGEFRNRMRYILESYEELSHQLETEKKQAQKRWAAQEKIIQKVTSSLYGMSGDLQGIAGREIIALPELSDDTDQ